MNADIQINNSANPKARYVTWEPAPCRIRLTNPSGVIGLFVNVTLTSVSVAGGGIIAFRKTATGPTTASVALQLPVSGVSVPFFVLGRFGHPSKTDADVRIEVRAGTVLIGQVRLMVRIRKNANSLTPAEIARFVNAFGQLNNQGAGRFADFRNMHTNAGSPQAHGKQGFLPWHRAYLLDLERELQAIDSSVAMPYWRFDQPAPILFATNFIGVSNANGTVQFSATNLLQFWVTDGIPGINRSPSFNTATGFATVINETQTLALGAGQYAPFRQQMENDPHGMAHVSFGGFISSIPTAARDPLFFLLHTNVDRLWAKWQRGFSRFDSTTAASYDSAPAPIGHNLPDSMWPWNGVTGPPRPPTAPGGALAASPFVNAPGPQPRVKDCLDYQGRINVAGRLGFDYDDVPWP
ncbi:MAG: tyrosinase [Verrucomicrobiota bacterium]|jgi:tyrosinase